MTSGFLVVNRDYTRAWLQLPYDERQQILRYRGFSGIDFWPSLEEHDCKSKVVNGLAMETYSDEVIKYFNFARSRHGENLDLLYLSSEKHWPCADAFKFIGVDVGVLVDQGDPVFFSTIFNEVRVSGNPALRTLVERLNNYYLFDFERDAQECLRLRRKAFEVSDIDYLESCFDHVSDVLRIYLYSGADVN